jgi:hypothetical protein
MILCECGDIVDNDTFKDYIKTSMSPSTPTIGHKKCGLIFDFVDGTIPKNYSSKVKLKSIAMKFAEKKKLDDESIGILLLEVDRLKSEGKHSDGGILVAAFKKVALSKNDHCCPSRRSTEMAKTMVSIE